MIVTTAGRAFEIGGAAYDEMPTWTLVKENDRPLTAADFDALPPDAREWLILAVEDYVAKTKEGRRTADAQ